MNTLPPSCEQGKQIYGLQKRRDMLDSLQSSMLFMKPFKRRDLANIQFANAILDFIHVDIRVIGDSPITPDVHFPMKYIYRINDRLERYLSTYHKEGAIGLSISTLVASANVATYNHAKENSLQTQNKNDSEKRKTSNSSPVVPQYFEYLEGQTNVCDDHPYMDRFMFVMNYVLRIDKSKWKLRKQ